MSEVAPAAPAAEPVVEAPPVVTATPEEPKPEKTFTQAELDDILEKRLSKERRKREESKRENEVLRKLALERTERREETPRQQPSADAEPKRESYDSYEAFIEARAEWRAEQKVEKKFAERDQKSKEDETRTAQEKQKDEFRKRTKELSKDLTDFEEVMAEATSSADSPVSRLFAEPIQECENPAAVLYHLAKNPEEAERIADLSGPKQAREIWALDAKLKGEPKPEPKKPSKAPEPIAPVGGKTAKGDDEPDPSNTKAWISWRERQIQKRRTGT